LAAGNADQGGRGVGLICGVLCLLERFGDAGLPGVPSGHGLGPGSHTKWRAEKEENKLMYCRGASAGAPSTHGPPMGPPLHKINYLWEPDLEPTGVSGKSSREN